MTNGLRVRSIRQAMKLNQKEFSEFLGYTQANVSGIETEKLPLSEPFIDRLMEKLPGLEQSFIKTGQGPMFKESQEEEMKKKYRDFVANGGVNVSGNSNRTNVHFTGAMEKDMEIQKMENEFLRRENENLKSLLASREELIAELKKNRSGL